MLDHLITSFPPDGERIYQAIAKYWFSRESKNFSIRVFWGKKKKANNVYKSSKADGCHQGGAGSVSCCGGSTWTLEATEGHEWGFQREINTRMGAK